MSYNWLDLSRKDEFEFIMVSPQSLDQVVGRLTDVDLSSTSITSAYYTDTRTSASVSMINAEQYVPNTRIRIVHKVPDWGYSKELGTYLVDPGQATRSYGAWKGRFRLYSLLEGLETNQDTKPWTVPVNASLRMTMMQMLSECNYECDLNSASDITSSSLFVYDTGSSFLSRLYDLCALSGNRLDVNGHGLVTVSPYVAPISKSPVFRLDLADVHGIVKDDVSFTSNLFDTPNRCIVTYRYTDEWNYEVEHEITAYVDATGENSIGSRGQVVADYYEVTELEPATYENALSIAKQRMAMVNEKIEWDLTTAYFPVWEGDTVEVVVHDGPLRFQGVRHCLVKNQEIDLSNMTMRLTLKETRSGDDE